MDKKFTQLYIDRLNQRHQQNIQDYGAIGWEKEPKCRLLYDDMIQITNIAQHIFGRNLVI